MAGKITGEGRTKREAAKLEARRAEVFRRWLDGEPMRSIGKNMVPRISATTVCHDVQIALRGWREHHRGSINEHAENELGRLNAISLQAQKSFECSEGPRGDKVGSAAHLSLMIACSKERRELLGVDQPARSEVKSEVTTLRTFATREQMYDVLKEFCDE